MPQAPFASPLDVQSLVDAAVPLLVAYALALPIGWDRERRERSAGLRTFPLVAMASCGYILVGRSFAENDPSALARVVEGLVTGVGFIGGGSILKDRGHVHGTATAASLWVTAAMGASVAIGRIDIGVVLSAITFATMRMVTPIKRAIKPPEDADVEELE